MGMSMTEKILARASGQRSVSPGDIVTVNVDLAVEIDVLFTTPGYHEIPDRVWNPDKIALILDHAVPAPTVQIANGLRRARHFVEKFGVKQYFSEGRQGISHQVIAERGLALPGQVLLCADSHTCASGAFNCLARGVGPQEMLYVICKGETWFIVYPTIAYRLEDRLSHGVYARDIVHYIAGKYGDHVDHNVEYLGPGIATLDISSRQTIATMSAELSAEFVLFEADDITRDYLATRTNAPYVPVYPDADANYASERTIRLNDIEPTVVLPHFVPHNVRTVSEVDETKIDQAFIGSCANARIEDLRIAAKILKGRKVHANTRLIITPASSEIMKQAAKEGLIEIFIEADAMVTNATCGACYGGHMGVVGDGERCVTTSTRNFKGRMGSADSEIYMASPATVAASAIAGKLADPRPLLAE